MKQNKYKYNRNIMRSYYERKIHLMDDFSYIYTSNIYILQYLFRLIPLPNYITERKTYTIYNLFQKLCVSIPQSPC